MNRTRFRWDTELNGVPGKGLGAGFTGPAEMVQELVDQGTMVEGMVVRVTVERGPGEGGEPCAYLLQDGKLWVQVGEDK